MVFLICCDLEKGKVSCHLRGSSTESIDYRLHSIEKKFPSQQSLARGKTPPTNARSFTRSCLASLGIKGTGVPSLPTQIQLGARCVSLYNL